MTAEDKDWLLKQQISRSYWPKFKDWYGLVQGNGPRLLLLALTFKGCVDFAITSMLPYNHHNVSVRLFVSSVEIHSKKR